MLFGFVFNTVLDSYTTGTTQGVQQHNPEIKITYMYKNMTDKIIQLFGPVADHTVCLIKKFTFRTVVNMHICVVHLTYFTLLLPRTYVLAGVRVVRVYRLKFLRSLANWISSYVHVRTYMRYT